MFVGQGNVNNTVVYDADSLQRYVGWFQKNKIIVIWYLYTMAVVLFQDIINDFPKGIWWKKYIANEIETAAL